MRCDFNQIKINANKNNEFISRRDGQTQYDVLSYRIDLYFHDYKLAIKTGQNGHIDRNIDYERRRRAIGQERGCKFFRIDPGEKHFDIFTAIIEIFRHIKQSTKKTLITTISTRLLGLEFKIK